MSLIKNAFIYKAEIPTDIQALNNHLTEKAFKELLDIDASSAGFVPPFGQGESLVGEFHGGLAFSVRVDEKIVPGAAIKTYPDGIKAVRCAQFQRETS